MAGCHLWSRAGERILAGLKCAGYYRVLAFSPNVAFAPRKYCDGRHAD